MPVAHGEKQIHFVGRNADRIGTGILSALRRVHGKGAAGGGLASDWVWPWAKSAGTSALSAALNAQRRTVWMNRQDLLSASYQAAKRRSRRKAPKTRLQGQTMGCGTNALLAESLSQTPSELRKDGSQFRCATHLGCRFNLLETDHCYIRIGSKSYILISTWRQVRVQRKPGQLRPLHSSRVKRCLVQLV
jgi:hypothetical protein